MTARDVERENYTQLKRWKKNRGELNFKSPPRMHGARVVLLSEPPRRQDLQQNPTIVLEVPQPTPQLKKKDRSFKKKGSIKKSQPVVEIPNPYSLPNDPAPPLAGPQAPPPPAGNKSPEAAPQTDTEPPRQQPAPPTEPPPAEESPLQQSTQSLSSTEQDTYL